MRARPPRSRSRRAWRPRPASRSPSSRQGFFPWRRILQPPMVSAHEHVSVEERRHGIVLARSFVRAGAVAAPGMFAVVVGWPATVVGAALLVVAALIAVSAVWRRGGTPDVLQQGKRILVAGAPR